MSAVKPRPMPAKLTKGPKKPRKRLRRVSAKKAEWLEKYHVGVQSRADQMMRLLGGTFCEKCGIPMERWQLEPHHPGGRIGGNILNFFLLGNNFSSCRCHAWIHENPKRARAEGWLI